MLAEYSVPILVQGYLVGFFGEDGGLVCGTSYLCFENLNCFLILFFFFCLNLLPNEHQFASQMSAKSAKMIASYQVDCWR